MPCQVTWDYDEVGEGWAEVYQISSDDPGSYVQIDATGNLSITCPAYAFMVARRGLLNGSSKVSHVRASKIRSPGVTASAGIPASVGVGRYSAGYYTGVINPAETFSKLLVRIQCGTTRRRTLWLGGIPETIVTPPNTYTPTDSWNTALGLLRSALIGGGTLYGIAGRPTRTTSPIPQSILIFTPDASAYFATVGVLSTAAYDSVNGGYCIIRGLRYPRGWNGVHLYQVQDATHLIVGPLRLPGHTVPAQRPGDRGSIQLFNPTFAQYTNINAERITRRKVGLPFGVTHGRGPAR